MILFFLHSRNDIGLSNSYYIPICKDCVSSEVSLKIRYHELYIHYMPVTAVTNFHLYILLQYMMCILVLLNKCLWEEDEVVSKTT